jgi:hypothetical protein
MAVVLSPNQSQIQTVLRSVLLSMLPSGVDVIEGQDNLVPEPAAADFVVMTSFQRMRLMTNVDACVDAAYTASLSGSMLIVSDLLIGTVEPGATLFGTNVASGSVIGTQINGTPGGVGTYNVTPSQTVTSETMASGAASVMQETEITFQLDVHGPNSADNAQTISTLFRDEYATSRFYELNPAVSPLYADDPRQMPFTNDQDQVETRYVIDAHIQANQVVSNIPQQFGDVFDVDLISVDVVYPP